MKPHIRSVSKARAKQRAEYERTKPIYLASHPICIVCEGWINPYQRTLHHYFKRMGRLLAWIPGYRSTHPDCHDLIHRDETEARRRGWLAPKECCNDYDKAVIFHRRLRTNPE